jgi:2-amino-4-hydroxy-6-hydroxymethyldihydropteridine diphosphokinase
MLGPSATPISPATGSPAPLDVVVGLGSNLGARAALLELAVARLSKMGSLVGLSSVYETAPVGPPQPHFLNAAVRLLSELSPSELLTMMLEIERLAGRERRERWGPRTLDLDLLWIRGRCVEEPGLVVPHARLHERPFALLPLLDVAPDAADPRTGAPYAAIALSLDCAGVRQLSPDEFSWTALHSSP